MLSEKSIFAYRTQFPDDECYFAEPSSLVFIKSNQLNTTFVSPFNENDTEFLERLENCKLNEVNLFYFEWEEFKGYNSNCLY